MVECCFVAGAILIGSGLISLAVLSAKDVEEPSLSVRTNINAFHRKTGTGMTQ